jgi:hypothetical protein
MSDSNYSNDLENHNDAAMHRRIQGLVGEQSFSPCITETVCDQS